MTKKFGFTLAEVLITLGIIGIVATITISTLVQNYQKKVIVERLRLTHAILSQAINMSINDNGATDNWTLKNDLSTVQGHIEYGDKYIAPYLNIVKKAGGSAGWWTCTPNKKFPGLYCVSSTSQKTNYSGWVPYIYYLSNGSSFSVGGWNQKVITIDVNGIEKPNRAGYDVFTFAISNNKLSSPKWTPTDTWSCNENSTHSYNGWTCASRIIENNWKIPKDYPW